MLPYWGIKSSTQVRALIRNRTRTSWFIGRRGHGDTPAWPSDILNYTLYQFLLFSKRMGASQLREIVTEKRQGATGIYILTCGFGSFVLFLLCIYFFS